jgi:hypothetical protein
MSSDIPKPDPLTEVMRRIHEERQRRSDEHAALRASEAYLGAMRQVDRYLFDYGLGISAIELMATRNPAFFDRLISLRVKPHFVQSMIAASYMIKEGLHDPARREMRFLVEAAVKALWLDQGSPSSRGDRERAGVQPPTTVAEKIAALDGIGRQRFDEIVDNLRFGMLDEAASERYRQTAKSLYGTLSTTTHVSSRNVERDFTNFDRGKHFAFETVANVDAIARLLRQVLDLALASHFESFDHGLVGDIFEPCFEPQWSFLKMPLIGAIDRHFDYKHERRVRRGEID